MNIAQHENTKQTQIQIQQWMSSAPHLTKYNTALNENENTNTNTNTNTINTNTKQTQIEK